VVVKRGHGANIREQDTPSYNSMDNTGHGMTWAEIKPQCIDFSIPVGDEDDHYFLGEGYGNDDDYFLAEGYESDEVDD